jgi:hypothetical protein
LCQECTPGKEVLSDFEWIMQGYITLATREEPLTLTVVKRISMNVAMEIATIREEIVRMKGDNETEQCYGRPRCEIVKRFGMELHGAGAPSEKLDTLDRSS